MGDYVQEAVEKMVAVNKIDDFVQETAEKTVAVNRMGDFVQEMAERTVSANHLVRKYAIGWGEACFDSQGVPELRGTL